MSEEQDGIPLTDAEKIHGSPCTWNFSPEYISRLLEGESSNAAELVRATLRVTLADVARRLDLSGSERSQLEEAIDALSARIFPPIDQNLGPGAVTGVLDEKGGRPGQYQFLGPIASIHELIADEDDRAELAQSIVGVVRARLANNILLSPDSTVSQMRGWIEQELSQIETDIVPPPRTDHSVTCPRCTCAFGIDAEIREAKASAFLEVSAWILPMPHPQSISDRNQGWRDARAAIKERTLARVHALRSK